MEFASTDRSHGIGLIFDGAPEGAIVSIGLATTGAEYKIRLALSSGRIETFAGERLYSRLRDVILAERQVGSDDGRFYHSNTKQYATMELREPEKLSLSLYLAFEDAFEEAAQIDRTLRRIHRYNSRTFNFYRIRRMGSDVGTGREIWLSEHCDNLWAVLRNLYARKDVDDRYDTIVRYMKRAFPSFQGILVEQTGPSVVYGSFVDRNRREPILASGVSDGHLQMLIILTCLFSEGPAQESVLLLDEPETSLHPWPIAVLAEAIKLASNEWNKQVLIATHSPVLLSQFDTSSVVATELIDGKSRLTRLSEMDGIQDLLDQYAAGSLYMANIIAPQGDVDAIEEAA